MFNRRTLKPTAIALAITLAASGCATIDKTLGGNNKWIACGLGATAGAALGVAAAAALGKDPLAYGRAGAAIGCGAGLAYKARVDGLRAIAQEEGLKMKVNTVSVIATPAPDSNGLSKEIEAGITASVEDSSMFKSGSAALTTDGERQVRRMAAVIADQQDKNQPAKQQEPKKILVVGHTDGSGSAELNQQLSEQRARAVASILNQAGIQAKDIYFQGAGASKPVADNSTVYGRDQNRRVEITEVASDEVLARMIQEDRNNPRYLAHGTRTAVVVSKVDSTNKQAAKTASQIVIKAPVIAKPLTTGQIHDTPLVMAQKAPEQPKVVAQIPADQALKLAGKGSIDFGGNIVRSTSSTLAQNLKPKPTAFALIDNAYAGQPVGSCLADMPRTAGEIKSLATGTTAAQFKTSEYLVGMNARSWGQLINGHVASLGPVAILKDGAKVAQEPDLQFIPNAQKGGKETPIYKAVANTYEGDGEVLYRVFALDPSKAPVSCMDIIFDTRNGTAKAGEMFYPRNGDAFVADFKPVRR
jgi:outer membrane protein OmpA-like peptidoglycan-associated protein